MVNWKVPDLPQKKEGQVAFSNVAQEDDGAGGGGFESRPLKSHFSLMEEYILVQYTVYEVHEHFFYPPQPILKQLELFVVAPICFNGESRLKRRRCKLQIL